MDKQLLFRRLGIILGVILLVIAVVMAKKLTAEKPEPPRKEEVRAMPAVSTFPATVEEVATTLSVQGELVAFDKIDIFSEVTGALVSTSRPFKVGTYFPQGAILIKIDNSEAHLALLAQKSSLLNAITQLMPDLKVDYPESFAHWQQYLDNFEPESAIKPMPDPLNDQEKYFIASRNLYTQYYNIKSQEERLDKYEIQAPFGGVITQTSINPGAVVRAGQKLGELMNTGNYELQVTVPLSDLKYIKTGNTVTLLSDDLDGEWSGRVKRINNQVDAGTQTVKVFISVSGQNLREGMYLRGDIAATSIADAVRIPRDLLIDQRAVYVVRDSTLELEPVQVVKITSDAAIVRGIPEGAQLLRELFPNAFDGMKVRPQGDQSSGQTSVNAVGSL
ncbi:efflux RND transporter periplasmic adaptor subunit [Flavilitoribacter nigricans]|uniref:HlyD family secretion protein n=1 Tax=Flavilitoribacter nigricans (strain ATCC 23147 / DSM 23189 / NBRC 102662 / NCIMB 1420 / SS-2) TaxID=1122177 RepID=A0A2D0NHQ4_FLAN2|nr:efflux RND transporter periplasmic adaptor subunit [Flavilitoribacter nigricans]PHN08025.1 HlyD family secretion protein [Flavilitoribacter nigricans DSM 23189 = NBRC 102662]